MDSLEDPRPIIRRFLALFDETERSVDEREEQLTLLLDELAVLVGKVPSHLVFDDFPDAPEPEEDFQALYSYSNVGKQFPNFGYYNTVSDTTKNIAETQVVVGDAIDDISDIARELREVLWIWETAGADAALWKFREMYRVHWGEHLRELQRYLFAYSRGV